MKHTLAIGNVAIWTAQMLLYALIGVQVYLDDMQGTVLLHKEYQNGIYLIWFVNLNCSVLNSTIFLDM